MKPSMIATLKRLTDLQTLRTAEELARQTAVLNQAARQRALLTAYRDKLARGWRDGDWVAAGMARRAMDFVAASHAADRTIGQMENQALQAIEEARTMTVRLRQRRQHLNDAQRLALRDDERARDLRQDRAQPPPRKRRDA